MNVQNVCSHHSDQPQWRNNFYPFALDWQEQSNGRQVIPGLGIYFLHPDEGKWTRDEIDRQMNFIRKQKMAGEGHYRVKYLMENTLRKIDGERVIVEIRTVNVGGNILPFKKEVYSSDAMEGIYVPGNAKAEINKDATAGAVDGTNPQITGGLDMGSQLIAGGVNGVVNATKQAASKNIKKVKVTIKTNYAVFLMEKKEPGES